MALTSRGFYDNDVTRKEETRGGVFANNPFFCESHDDLGAFTNGSECVLKEYEFYYEILFENNSIGKTNILVSTGYDIRPVICFEQRPEDLFKSVSFSKFIDMFAGKFIGDISSYTNNELRDGYKIPTYSSMNDLLLETIGEMQNCINDIMVELRTRE